MKKRALKSIFQDDPQILALIEARKYAEEAPALDELRSFFRGDKGYSPVKGKDYFTKEEIAAFKEAVTPKKFKDYFTDKEIEWMMMQIQQGVFASVTDTLK